MLSTSSQYGANTLQVTLAVEKVLADLQPALNKQGIVLYSKPCTGRPISSSAHCRI